MFITFEGIDNSGKTTAAKALVQRLNDCGRKAIFTYEPGGTTLGKEVRELILGNPDIDLDTKALLINACRIDHVKKVIRPAIQKGTIVVCDRFFHSTIAYQKAQGWSNEFLLMLNAFCIQGLIPDVTFWLDVPLEVASEREQDGKDFCSDEDYLRKVIKNYTALSNSNSEQFKRIDATQTPEQVLELIWLVTREKLKC